MSQILPPPSGMPKPSLSSRAYDQITSFWGNRKVQLLVGTLLIAGAVVTIGLTSQGVGLLGQLGSNGPMQVYSYAGVALALGLFLAYLGLRRSEPASKPLPDSDPDLSKKPIVVFSTADLERMAAQRAEQQRIALEQAEQQRLAAQQPEPIPEQIVVLPPPKPEPIVVLPPPQPEQPIFAPTPEPSVTPTPEPTQPASATELSPEEPLQVTEEDDLKIDPAKSSCSILTVLKTAACVIGASMVGYYLYQHFANMRSAPGDAPPPPPSNTTQPNGMCDLSDAPGFTPWKKPIFQRATAFTLPAPQPAPAPLPFCALDEVATCDLDEVATLDPTGVSAWIKPTLPPHPQAFTPPAPQTATEPQPFCNPDEVATLDPTGVSAWKKPTFQRATAFTTPSPQTAPKPEPFCNPDEVATLDPTGVSPWEKPILPPRPQAFTPVAPQPTPQYGQSFIPCDARTASNGEFANPLQAPAATPSGGSSPIQNPVPVVTNKVPEANLIETNDVVDSPSPSQEEPEIINLDDISPSAAAPASPQTAIEPNSNAAPQATPVSAASKPPAFSKKPLPFDRPQGVAKRVLQNATAPQNSSAADSLPNVPSLSYWKTFTRWAHPYVKPIWMSFADYFKTLANYSKPQAPTIGAPKPE